MINNNHSITQFFLLPGICYLTELAPWSFYPQSHCLNAVLSGLSNLRQIFWFRTFCMISSFIMALLAVWQRG